MFSPGFPAPVEPPIVKPVTLPRPGPSRPDITGVLLWAIETLRENVEIGDDDSWFKDYTDTRGQSVRRKSGKACGDCCKLVVLAAQKAVRRLPEFMDQVSPKTEDTVKRYRRAKVTRDPAY